MAQRSSILQGGGVGVGNPVQQQQQQQQGTWAASPLTQRKVTMAGQQGAAAAVAAPAGRGVTPQQNRVCEEPLHAFPSATLTIYLY